MNVITIQIMGKKVGHDNLEYDPDIPEDISRVKKAIIDKLELGWILFGAKVGEELVMIADKNILKKEGKDKSNFIEEKMEELDRFIMDRDITKRMLAPVQTGG